MPLTGYFKYRKAGYVTLLPYLKKTLPWEKSIVNSQMRKLIYAINLSVDGCCDHTKLSGGEDVHEYFTALMQDVDLLVYGRKTYELMVPYWPNVPKINLGKQKQQTSLPKHLIPFPSLFSRGHWIALTIKIRE